MANYESPRITELGSVQDLTLTTFHKSPGKGDVILIAGEPPIDVPGSGLS